MTPEESKMFAEFVRSEMADGAVPLVCEPARPDKAVFASTDWLEALSKAFKEVSKQRRDLEDHSIHEEDRQRARLRSCICMDIAEALRIAELGKEAK